MISQTTVITGNSLHGVEKSPCNLAKFLPCHPVHILVSISLHNALSFSPMIHVYQLLPIFDFLGFRTGGSYVAVSNSK